MNGLFLLVVRLWFILFLRCLGGDVDVEGSDCDVIWFCGLIGVG